MAERNEVRTNSTRMRSNAPLTVRVVLWAIVAIAIGLALCLGIAFPSSGGLVAGFQLCGYMGAAAAIGAIFGLIFGVPRSRTETTATPRERFGANSNLEQISDWLTKILVGAGLVQLGSVPSALERMGSYLGSNLNIPNGEATAVAIVLYGVGIGFTFGYLWSRLRLRILLETAERVAEEQSRLNELADSLAIAVGKAGLSETRRQIEKSAEIASHLAERTTIARSILWVDDEPSGNAAFIDVFKQLGVSVTTAVSTDEATARLQVDDFGLVITDLGRVEAGVKKPDAGIELLQKIASSIPVFVFTSRRGTMRREELLAAGARLVTASPTELLPEAMAVLT